MNVKKLLGLASIAMIGGLFFSNASFADRYEGETARVSLERRGIDLKGDVTLEATVTARIFRVTGHWVTVSRPIWVEHCPDGHGGTGKSEAWNRFYSAPKSQKPRALADAVRGIGPSTAECLVDRNYFSSKPRSWSEFKGVIRRADRNCGENLYENVIQKYGSDNMDTLGYRGDAASCHYAQEPEFYDVYEEVRRYVRDAQERFTIEVENAPLLKLESEKFTIAYDGFSDSLNVDSAFNSFQQIRQNAGDRVVYVLRGQRKPAQPLNTLVVTPRSVAGKLVLDIQDTQYDPSTIQELGTTYMVYSVMEDKLIDKAHVKNVQVELNSRTGRTTVNTGFSMSSVGKGWFSSKKHMVFVDYKVRRAGTNFFNGGVLSREGTSSKIQAR